MEKLKEVLLKVVIVIFAVGIVYVGWELKRSINYSMSYDDKVIATIHEQNKPLLKRIKVLENEVKLLKEGK
jgi:cell division protein FtsB